MRQPGMIERILTIAKKSASKNLIRAVRKLHLSARAGEMGRFAMPDILCQVRTGTNGLTFCANRG